MLPEVACIVTDRSATLGGDLTDLLARALLGLPPGTALVQLREKDLSGRALCELAAAVVEVSHRGGARVLVNDRVDVALAAGADGVHLPENGLPVEEARRMLGPSRLVGASTHSSAGALAKARAGADLVLLGPIWTTPSKSAFGPPLGLPELTVAARELSRVAPRSSLFAVGGVDSPSRAAEAVASGARGVAMIRAVAAAVDPRAAVAALCTAARAARATSNSGSAIA